LKFENTLALIRSGSYAQAAAEMVKSKWAKQVGKRADRLANMMKTGEVTDD
jgi:lysozyme